MSSKRNKEELHRLTELFEKEAAQFHDLSLTVFYMDQTTPVPEKTFRSPNHIIVLWQYYGKLNDDNDVNQLATDVAASDLNLAGIRGSEFSCYGLVEGPLVERFMRMAQRAGSVFSEKEIFRIKERSVKDFKSNYLGDSPGKTVFVGNDSKAAVWLNFVLYHLRKTHPVRFPETRISLDPFASSLSALDSLFKHGSYTEKRQAGRGIESTKFRIALSFPGEHRTLVESIANSLRNTLGDHSVFYDYYYKPELARPNLDTLLQKIYVSNSDLVVVFLCSKYNEKEWCGLEWRAIRDMLKRKEDERIMLLRMDKGNVDGIFSIDGYIDIEYLNHSEISELILSRAARTPSRKKR